MDHPDLTVSNYMEISIGLKWFIYWFHFALFQAGVETDIPKNDSVINIEDLICQSAETADLDFIAGERGVLGSNSSVKSLNFEETSQSSLTKADSVEELDSPESISQIDREDCFSWEEDRLLLAIDENAKPVDDTAGLVSSFKEPAPIQMLTSRTQSVEEKKSEKVVEDKSDIAGRFNEKQGSRESSPGSQNSPGKSMSSAF